MFATHLASMVARTLVLGLPAVFALLTSPGVAAQSFQPVDLGVAPGFVDSAAFDVNNNREVTGTLTQGGVDPIAFVWLPAPAYGLPAGMTALGTLPSGGFGFSFGHAINDCGQVIGSSTTVQAVRAFLWQNGVMSDLSSLAGGPTGWSGVGGINDKGYVVGYSDDSLTPPVETHPFLTCRLCAQPLQCMMTDLGTLGGPWAAAHAINDKNQIAGESRLDAPPGQYPTHAFFVEPTSAGLTDLGVLPNGVASVATALNEKPVVVGWCGVQDASGYTERVVMWRRLGTQWTITDLGRFEGNTYNTPYAINDSGWIVGRAYSPGTAPQPFLWIQGVFRNINDLIVHTGTQPIVIEDALGMNDRGDIAAFGYNENGEARAFLLRRL